MKLEVEGQGRARMFSSMALQQRTQSLRPHRRNASKNPELARLRVLYKISNILTTTQRSETVLRLILKEAVKATRATSGSLILIDRAAGILNIEIADNINPARAAKLKLRLGEGVTGWVAKKGKPLLVGDVRSSPHYVQIKAEVKCELAVPLIIGGKVVGVINVDSNRRDAFNEADKQLLVAVAAQSSRVMQAATLYEENRNKAKRLATLFNVGRAIASEPLLEDVLRRVADEVRRLMDVRVCSIMLLDEKAENFEIKAVSGEVSPAYFNRKRIPVTGNLIGRVIESRRPLYVRDVRREKEYRMAKVARESGLCSLLSIPMVFQDRPIGVLNVYSGRPSDYSNEDVELITTFAGDCAVAIVNASRYERIIRSEELLRESEKFQLLGTLAAEIAHEIRNPLTILSMLVHSLQESGDLSRESRFDLGIMQTKLTHINKIVDQVLDFSRSRQGEPVEVNINRIVEDVHMLIGHKASGMNRRVMKRCREGLPAVRVDPGQLEQAILNLAINGLEAMADQGDCLHVSTSRVKKGDKEWVRVRVRDEGRGIPAEEIQSIFTPFISMRDQGTGLGLFIARRIVTEHGGRLEVKSRVGKGSTFDILLPAVDSDPR